MQPEIGGQLIPVFSGGFRGNYYDGIDLGLNALFPFIEKSAVHTSRTVNLIAPQVSINPTWWADFTWVKETLAKIGISVQSVISHNTSMCELKEAASAAANILLTQDAGRKFCKRMEDELGVPTILSDLPMPIGMNNTNRWLRAIGEHFGVQSEVEKVITDGEKVVVDVLRRRALMIIPRYRNCHVAVSADATFGIGLLRMLFEELEMIPDLLLIRSDADDTRKVLQKELDDLRISPNIVMGVDGYKIKKALSDAEPDAVIGSSWEKYIAEEVGIKLAFDCFAPTNRVSYVDRSYFGYQGMLNLLEVVANDWETAFRSKEIDPALLS
jgi:nitrogenase molybdenum-iron protein alpha/beta subunit